MRWTLRARADLKAIHDFIAPDSPHNAKSVVREIVQRASLIDQTPSVGRQVVESEDILLREIPVHSWRVLYQHRGDDVIDVTIVHKRRLSGIRNR